ncbi:unnamed protein product, partial [Clonostachys solani]
MTGLPVASKIDILGSVVSALVVGRGDVGEASREEVEDAPDVVVCASAELAAGPRNSSGQILGASHF